MIGDWREWGAATKRKVPPLRWLRCASVGMTGVGAETYWFVAQSTDSRFLFGCADSE
jgi:hypothetical protein